MGRAKAWIAIAGVVALGTAALAACDDGGASGAPSGEDVTSTPDGAVGGDVTPDEGTTPDEGGAQDVPPVDDTQPEPDEGPQPDAGPDVAPDAEPETQVEPKAAVFVHDPNTDDYETTEVTLRPPVTDDGTLMGEFVEVRNCLNEEGGEPIGGGAALCRETRVASPGEDGTYLHIVPPSIHSDPNDTFAEVMMYHHVNVMHDYYKDVHGLTDLDFPLQALVNVQINAGAFGGWQGFPNAAFIPEEGFQQFGLPKRDFGAIVFGQYQVTDFAYDASVIYHEYTHAMIGTTRLTGVLADTWGLDSLPGAMNEGFADYFATSMKDHPVVGAYGLSFAGEHMVRDLTNERTCPDDLFGEIHVDGKIIGSAMWALREQLGRDVTDGMILRALQSFTNFTTMEMAGQLILDEAELLGPDEYDTTEAILTEYGVIGCEREKAWEAFDAEGNDDQLPYFVAGTQNVQAGQLPEGAPGYFQFRVDVPEGAEAVTLSWAAEAQPSFLGGGGPVDLDIAAKKGSKVVFGALTGGDVTADGKWTAPKMPSDQAWQGVTLTGDCLPADGGPVYLMFLNTGDGQATIQGMDLSWPEDASSAPNVVTCQ
ncbi:MAG: M36 family metallopeptidase [Myxococcota bacterium]